MMTDSDDKRPSPETLLKLAQPKKRRKDGAS